MRDDNEYRWQKLSEVVTFDYMSLYPEMHLDIESITREINKKRLNEKRKEKLERLNNL